MAFKEVKVCDLCGHQKEWTDMLPTATPAGWRQAVVTEKEDEPEVYGEDTYIYDICDGHASVPITYALRVILQLQHVRIPPD